MIQKQEEMTQQESGKRKSRVTKDAFGRRWDSLVAERYYLEQFLQHCVDTGKPEIITFMLRDGSLITGVFVEMGQFAYIVDVKLKGGGRRRAIVHKHALTAVYLQLVEDDSVPHPDDA